MAARIVAGSVPSARRQRPLVRPGLSPRTIYFPPAFLERYDREPGQLIDVLTTVLTRFLAEERGGVH